MPIRNVCFSLPDEMVVTAQGSIVCTFLIANFIQILYRQETVLLTLSCVIPVVCVTNEREESVVNQHN